MKAVAAVVEAAVDIQQMARVIAKEHIALQDCERQLDASERKTEGLREQQRRHRVELGRLLIEAKRGVKHGGWLPYLEKLGIEDRRAREWMQLAGWVDSKSAASGNVADLLAPAPTLADAGIDKRPRKSKPEPEEIEDDEDKADEPAPTPRAPSLDIDAEIWRMHDKLCAFAEKAPVDARKRIAHQLRETAKLIERMQ